MNPAPARSPIASCPSCAKKYRVGEAPPASIDCRACGASIDLSRFQPAAPAADPKAEAKARYKQAHRETFGGTPGPITLALMLINGLVFVAMAVSGVSIMNPEPATLIAWGGTYAPLTLGGEPWRLLSSTFVHSGVLHLIFNMLYLWLLGNAVERRLGRLQFISLYLASGIVAALGSTMVHSNMVSVGASGAIFALLGAVLVMSVNKRVRMTADQRKVMRNVSLAILAFEIIGVARPSRGDFVVDHAAHLVGLLAGAALTALVIEMRTKRMTQRVVAAALSGIALIALAAPMAIAAPANQQAAYEAAVELEQPALEALKAALDSYDRGDAAGKATAETIERDALPLWQQMLAKMVENRAENTRLGRYVRAKTDAVEKLIEAFRTEDRNKIMSAAVAFGKIRV